MEISITLIIVIITTIVSISAFSNQRMMNDLIFYPPSIQRGQWYRFFTSGIIHADWGHLIFNMYALWIFGAGQYKTGVEYKFVEIFGDKGKWLYLLMYILALGAAIIPTYAKTKGNYHYRALGASGAVSAVVFVKILLEPINGIGLFFIPVFIAGFLFGIIYLFVSGWLDKTSSGNVNHSAHIFGALFGVGFTILACKFLSDYPVLTYFIESIQNMDPKDIIQFPGRR